MTCAAHPTELLNILGPIERFWAFPGTQAFQRLRRLFAAGRYDRFAALAGEINRALATDSYRSSEAGDLSADDDAREGGDVHRAEPPRTDRPYFEVLVVEDLSEAQERALREELRRWRRPDDPFVYEIVVVPSVDDAIMAARLNFRLQACVVRRRFTHRSRHESSFLAQFVVSSGPDDRDLGGRPGGPAQPPFPAHLPHPGRVPGAAPVHPGRGRGRGRGPVSRAVLQRAAQLQSPADRVFHALPISHGKSIVNSHWIKDMLDFYGLNIFLAETSATCGGLDSLLEPTGPLREAQQLAAKTFGSRQTYFVTNGTSTASKVVVQALVQPGDIVLVDRNCHQSHHYGLMLAGAMVTYLDAYRLNEYSMYGAVPMREIKRRPHARRTAAPAGLPRGL